MENGNVNGTSNLNNGAYNQNQMNNEFCNLKDTSSPNDGNFLRGIFGGNNNCSFIIIAILVIFLIFTCGSNKQNSCDKC